MPIKREQNDKNDSGFFQSLIQCVYNHFEGSTVINNETGYYTGPLKRVPPKIKSHKIKTVILKSNIVKERLFECQ